MTKNGGVRASRPYISYSFAWCIPVGKIIETKMNHN